MDDPGSSVLLTDPFGAIVSLGVFVGVIAAFYWLRVYRAIDELAGDGPSPERRHLSSAAFTTAAALFLVCGGYLVGRVVGRF